MTKKTWLGAFAWVFGIAQFVVVMLVVQRGWDLPYSWADHNISDLGMVRCGRYDGRAICSPLHDLMNGSFVAGGLLIAAGALLTGPAWPRGSASRWARTLLAATGAGWTIAGLAPADVNENLHVLGGALVIFAAGNTALLVTGLLPATGPIGRHHRAAATLGLIGLVTTVLHIGGVGLGLGVGGMERLTAFAVPVWLLIAATSVLRTAPLATCPRPQSKRLRGPRG